MAAIRAGGAYGSTSASTAEGSRFESGPTLQRCLLHTVASFIYKPSPVKVALLMQRRCNSGWADINREELAEIGIADYPIPDDEQAHLLREMGMDPTKYTILNVLDDGLLLKNYGTGNEVRIYINRRTRRDYQG